MRAQQEWMFRQQMDMARANQAMAMDAQRRQEEENRYRRNIENLNRRIAQDERDYQISRIERNDEARARQRADDVERQLREDDEARRIQEFNLNRLLQRDDIADDERRFAIEELRRVQAQAGEEAQEDRRRFLSETAQKQWERDFQIRQYEDARLSRQAERELQLANQDAIRNRIDEMQRALEQGARTLPATPRLAPLDEADIDAEVDRRTAQYREDVDRAASMVASRGEADLIRRGMDESTQATARRGDITERVAKEYQDARDRAYDDALKYITGQQAALSGNVTDIADARQRDLSEIASVSGAGIDQLSRIPAAPSSLDAYRLAQGIPSGLHSRGLASANTYRAPIHIGTSAVTGSLSPRLAQYKRPTSLVSNDGFNLRSAAVGPAPQTIPSPSTFWSNSQSIANNLSTVFGDAYTDALTRSRDASSGFGQDFSKFAKDYGDDIANWFRNDQIDA